MRDSVIGPGLFTLGPAPRRAFRCSKGHEWTQPGWQTTLQFHVGTYITKSICPLCAIEAINAASGDVEEITEPAPDAVREAGNGPGTRSGPSTTPESPPQE